MIVIQNLVFYSKRAPQNTDKKSAVMKDARSGASSEQDVAAIKGKPIPCRIDQVRAAQIQAQSEVDALLKRAAKSVRAPS